MAHSKKTAPDATPAEPARVVTEVTHTIELGPEDRAWAAWNTRAILTRPEPAPFDFEACRKRLIKNKRSYTSSTDWESAKIAPILSRKEAHFWFLAMTPDQDVIDSSEVAARVKEQDVTGEIDAVRVVNRIRGYRRYPALPALRVLFNLFDSAEILGLMQSEDVVSTYWHANQQAANEFIRHVLPYVSADEEKTIRELLRPLVVAANWPTSYSKPPGIAFYLAGRVGLSDELLAVVRSLSTASYDAQYIVFGLGSPQLVEAETRRLKLSIQEPFLLRAWFALVGFAGLDYARDQILAETRKDRCEPLVAEFARVKAPEAAPSMLEFKIATKAPAPARAWLAEQVGNAVAGLLPVAAGRGKLAEAAIDYLREVKRKGHEALVRAAVEGAVPAVAEAVRKNVLEHVEKIYPLLEGAAMQADLAAAFTDAKAKKAGKLPDWAVPAALPPIVIGGHRLADEHVAVVLEGLRRSAPDAPGPLVAAVKKHADPAALDAFAWKLFQLWQGDGYPPKEKWAMGAIGVFGGAPSALKLTPLIRNWPGESQHARAVFGLLCLRGIGSDTALMQLNGIAQKLKFKGLKQKATEAMEAIAKEKGLTRQQLEDRVVPDCDLDERGQRVFDFGTRQFRFVLGPEMKPMVKDADGKVKTDLPKPGVKDDATKAAEAVAAWKLMKKQVKEVTNLQSARLEQAMVTGRRWPIADFESLLVKHPLMIHLVRLLLWASYDKAGKLCATFRVTEDQTFADAKDATFSLAGLAEIGVVHPLHLADEVKAAWGEVFSDYEIVPPFPQLGRSIHRLEKDERTATELTRYDGVQLPAPTLVFGLENRGWTRGHGMDNGAFDEHSKPFPGCNVTAVVHYDGNIGFGYIDPNETLSFERCYFVAGIRGPSGFERRESALELGKVDPVAVSEVLSDLSALAAKAK
jgi:hypothetical protein